MVSTTFGSGRLANSSGVTNGDAGSGTGAPFFRSFFSMARCCFAICCWLISSWFLQVRLAHFAAEEPEAERDHSLAEREDRLPNEMDRAKPSHRG